MKKCKFDFEMILLGKDSQRRLGRMPIDPDFVPAIEAVLFDLLRKRGPGHDTCANDVKIEPLFAPRVGPDRIKGFRVAVDGESRDALKSEFPLGYFEPLA